MLKIKDRITFNSEKGTEINISFTNDFIMHTSIQDVANKFMKESVSNPEEKVANGFYHLFEKIAKYIKCTDISFSNLETPIAKNLKANATTDNEGRFIAIEKELASDILHDDNVYGFYPYNYNVHPGFALALKKVGWNIVNMANNHIYDRFSNGIDKTIKTLEKYGIDHVGSVTYKQIKNKEIKDIWDIEPYVIKQVRGIKVAFFGATQYINSRHDKDIKRLDRNIPLIDLTFLINKPHKCIQAYKLGKGRFLSTFNGKNIPKLIKWIKKAKNIDGADMIVLYLHWGFENFTKKNGHYPDFLQRKWSKLLFEAGADIIVGGHVHTLQSGYKYKTKDGRETFVCYSLGNFLTDYINDNKIASAILYVTIVKNEKGTFIKKIKYLPTYSISKRDGEKVLDIQVVPIDKYEKLKYLFSHYHKILGKYNLISTDDLEKEYKLK